MYTYIYIYICISKHSELYCLDPSADALAAYDPQYSGSVVSLDAAPGAPNGAPRLLTMDAVCG